VKGGNPLDFPAQFLRGDHNARAFPLLRQERFQHQGLQHLVAQFGNKGLQVFLGQVGVTRAQGVALGSVAVGEFLGADGRVVDLEQGGRIGRPVAAHAPEDEDDDDQPEYDFDAP